MTATVFDMSGPRISVGRERCRASQRAGRGRGTPADDGRDSRRHRAGGHTVRTGERVHRMGGMGRRRRRGSRARAMAQRSTCTAAPSTGWADNPFARSAARTQQRHATTAVLNAEVHPRAGRLFLRRLASLIGRRLLDHCGRPYRN